VHVQANAIISDKRAGDAIQFDIEVLPSQSLAGAYLQIEEERFDAEGIRLLYESREHQLIRSRADAPSLYSALDPERNP
jgi:hypothetical protein